MHLTTLEVSFLKKLAFSDTKQVKSFKIKAQITTDHYTSKSKTQLSPDTCQGSQTLPCQEGSRSPSPLVPATKNFATMLNHKLTVLETPGTV